ncbi:hypothetical protein OUZ56_024219 [Daphnia magna]|uniref:Uncharacterized protein n=1 Tax=Daphnia magna TaxID=35525 RepID=A0ABR0B0C6_9CRUS|nr:hypothetical protein OUZ56_024219 [Daphnia magna]
MQCDQRRAKHAQAVTTAQYNGWLAAAQLGLRQCIKLITTGNNVSALQCTPTTVNFTTDTTTCGPQPRIVIPQRDLAAFRNQDVNFFEYQHQTNPAYTEVFISPMDIMADITGSMNEHSLNIPNEITGTSAIVVSATEKAGLGTFTNWFEDFRVERSGHQERVGVFRIPVDKAMVALMELVNPLISSVGIFQIREAGDGVWIQCIYQ